MVRMTQEQLNGLIAEIVRRVESDPMPDGMQRMLDAFHDGVAENFHRAVSSEGVPWPERKPDWVGDGHPLLIDPSDEYDLYAAATGGGINRIENRAFESGVSDADHPGALLHNFGGEVGGWFAGKGVQMPPREYLYANDEALDAMADILADQVQAIVASVVGGVTVGPSGPG